MSRERAEPERDLFGREAPEGTWAHRRGEPRMFALGWTALLLASTGAALAASGLGWVFSDESFRANVQRLMLVVSVLTTLLWPMVRLSQARPSIGGVRATLRDVVIVVVPMQAVIWPQALPPAAWPVSVAGAVSLYLAGWAVVVGGVLALALGAGRAGGTLVEEVDKSPGNLWRVLWMALVVVLVVGGLAPALMDVSQGADRSAPRPLWLLSPQAGVFELTRDRSWTGQLVAVESAHWRAIGWVWLAGAGVWLVALVRGLVRRGKIA